MNQELESTLQCLSSSNSSDRSKFLPWAEYEHNFHTSAATGRSPFEDSLGYHPPLFPADEKDISVTSVKHHIQRCRRIWSTMISVLQHSECKNRCFADHRHTPGLQYSPGQRVWLSCKNIPFRSIHRKLAMHFIGPFVIESVIIPITVSLLISGRMPRSTSLS